MTSVIFFLLPPSSSSYLVDRIRPVLCLQTEGAVLPVPNAALSRRRAVQEVGGVELDSWLAGRNLQDPPTGWVTHSEMKRQVLLLVFIKDREGQCVSSAADLAAGLSVQVSPGEDRQKLWSNPGPGTSFSRGPIRTGCLRSNRVPSTRLISPTDRLGY